jgi:hypothetical protein
MLYSNVSQTFLLADPFWHRKITIDPHIFAQVKIGCPDDRCSKLKIYNSEIILDTYEYVPIATQQCIP